MLVTCKSGDEEVTRALEWWRTRGHVNNNPLTQLKRDLYQWQKRISFRAMFRSTNSVISCPARWQL